MSGFPESVLIFAPEDSFGHGRYLDVTRCTAFRPTSAIRCGKLCRYLQDFPGPRGVPTGQA